jgi:hypothetical protein
MVGGDLSSDVKDVQREDIVLTGFSLNHIIVLVIIIEGVTHDDAE